MFITHGMGQQVPFATLDAVFERLRRQEPFVSARPEAETVRLDGQQMQRLVLRLPSQGREVHFYEGYTPQEVMFPIRVLGRLGVKVVILTNAAGSVNTGFAASTIMPIPRARPPKVRVFRV